MIPRIGNAGLSSRSMRVNLEFFTDRLFEALINGRREEARRIVIDATGQGATAITLLQELYWPVHELIEKLYRGDQMSRLSYRLATRFLRVLVDQASLSLDRRAPRGRRVFAVCGPTDADELGAQIAVDLIEREGFDIQFCGSGIAADEILAHVQSSRPDVLLIFASAPTDLPEIRGLIDTLNEIGAVRNLQVAVGGGVFNRAEGLAEEIGADVWAESPHELVQTLIEMPERRARAEQHSVGKKRRPKLAA